jgi:hypothetical protein
MDNDKWFDVERLHWSRIFSIPTKESVPEDFLAFTLGALCTLSQLFPNLASLGAAN